MMRNRKRSLLPTPPPIPPPRPQIVDTTDEEYSPKPSTSKGHPEKVKHSGGKRITPHIASKVLSQMKQQGYDVDVPLRMFKMPK